MDIKVMAAMVKVFQAVNPRVTLSGSTWNNFDGSGVKTQ